jgi:[ribosomal protein S5]-alanine N-acetyltransferase
VIADIVTARLVLRAPRADDLAAFHAIMADAETMRHWSTPPHESPAVTQEWLQRMLDTAALGHERVIVRDGQVIGKAGGYRLPEVGFILHRDQWGQGIVTEAMAAIIPFIWATSDTDHLMADVDPLNGASVRVLTKLGFVESHRAPNTFCINGVWSDSVYLRLDRPGDPA